MEVVATALKPYFKGLIVGNYGYTPESGLEMIKAGVVGAITFGRAYINNPDLAERIIAGYEISQKIDYATLLGKPGQE